LSVFAATAALNGRAVKVGVMAEAGGVDNRADAGPGHLVFRALAHYLRVEIIIRVLNKRLFAMARTILLAGILLGLLAGTAPERAAAASYDGNWSVLIITESGTCDAAYRYAVKVGSGNVAYAGDASINLSGTVSSGGAVKVSISKGGQNADAAGRLSAKAGSGNWRGQSSSGTCKGRWEAERR
jgi:hypothetical protein